MNRFVKISSRLFAVSLIASLLLLIAACGGGTKETTGTGAASAGEPNAELPKEIRIGYQVSPNGELMAKLSDSQRRNFPA